jgi:hypothetical protein
MPPVVRNLSGMVLNEELAACGRWPATPRRPLKSIVPPENSAPWKLAIPPENAAPLKSPLSNLTPVKSSSRRCHDSVAAGLRCAVVRRITGWRMSRLARNFDERLASPGDRRTQHQPKMTKVTRGHGPVPTAFSDVSHQGSNPFRDRPPSLKPQLAAHCRRRRGSTEPTTRRDRPCRRAPNWRI